MNVVRLTRLGPLSPARRKRRLRSGIAAVAASALLVLTACSGSPDAPATVGPTATPEQLETYKPTPPPYTSEVELSAEDEEDVEELLLLIEQFGTYTADVTEMHQNEIRLIQENLSEDMKSSYDDFVHDAEAGKINVVGEVSITDRSIWRYESKSYAMVALCYEYDHWAVIDQDTGAPMDGQDPNRKYEQMAYVQATLEANGWVVYKQTFYNQDAGCDGIR